MPLQKIQSVLECRICFQPFDIVRVPMKGLCGHTLCHLCQQMSSKQCNGKCPFCRMDKSFVESTGNWILIDEMADIKHYVESMEQTIRDNHRRKVLIEREHERYKQELQEKLEQLKQKLEKVKFDETQFFDCPDCHVRQSIMGARICLDKFCCDYVKRKAGHVVMVDDDKARRQARCGSCFVSGEHKYHESARFQIIMFLAQFEKIVRNTVIRLQDMESIDTKSLSDSISVLRRQLEKSRNFDDCQEIIQSLNVQVEQCIGS